VLAALSRDGATVTMLERLGMRETGALQRALTDLVARLADRPRDGRNTIRPSVRELFADTGVWRWGLQEELLDLVENYIGLPLMYQGADVRCEVANGQVSGVRQWHCDVEDHRQFKIIVWLADVDPGGGPFEYIDRDTTAAASRALRYVSADVSDKAMNRAVPDRHWRPCPGPAWTAVIADTANVFHRLKAPVTGDRYSVTFSWTSRELLKAHPRTPPTPEQRARLLDGLNPRQLASLPPVGPHAHR